MCLRYPRPRGTSRPRSSVWPKLGAPELSYATAPSTKWCSWCLASVETPIALRQLCVRVTKSTILRRWTLSSHRCVKVLIYIWVTKKCSSTALMSLKRPSALVQLPALKHMIWRMSGASYSCLMDRWLTGLYCVHSRARILVRTKFQCQIIEFVLKETTVNRRIQWKKFCIILSLSKRLLASLIIINRIRSSHATVLIITVTWISET